MHEFMSNGLHMSNYNRSTSSRQTVLGLQIWSFPNAHMQIYSVFINWNNCINTLQTWTCMSFQTSENQLCFGTSPGRVYYHLMESSLTGAFHGSLNKPWSAEWELVPFLAMEDEIWGPEVDDNIDQRESRLTNPIWCHCQISKWMKSILERRLVSDSDWKESAAGVGENGRCIFFLSGVDERHLPEGGLWDENEGGFGRTRRR